MVTARNGVISRSAKNARPARLTFPSRDAFPTFGLSKGSTRTTTKRTAGQMMAVSFAISAAMKAATEAMSHATEVCDLVLAWMRFWDFLRGLPASDCAPATTRSAYSRYRSKLTSKAPDISGSGTVTHATDSVCAGCSANRVPATNAATRSLSSFQTNSPSKTATNRCFATLSRCHPQEDVSLRIKFRRNQTRKSGR